MLYNVGLSFLKLEEISGTVYNKSDDCTIEISTKPVIGSGDMIFPQDSHSFRYHEMYVRCVDGTAEVECVPYDLDPSKHVDGDAFVEDGDYLHLTFDFPTGSNKTMLLRNPRPDLTIADLENFSEYTIEKDIFRNDFAEPTMGIKKIMMIKSLKRGKADDSEVTPIDVPPIDFDTRRKLTRDFDETFDLRRVLSIDWTIFNADLRRRVKWRWLTRILPDSSFLDPKMYAAADALDDQITLFHWAIKQVLHLPRLGELSGAILDLLAYQFHVDYYDAINFTDDEKRDLIRNSIAWHRIKGTPAAVEMVLSVFFKNYRLEEWFDYGGEPYYFRLSIKGGAFTPGRFQSFWNMLMDAKNVRSHLEKITQDLSPDDPIDMKIGIVKYVGGTKRIGMKIRVSPPNGQISCGLLVARRGTKRIGMKQQTLLTGQISCGLLVARRGTKQIGMTSN